VDTAVAILFFPSYGIIIGIYKFLTKIWNLVIRTTKVDC
jgi:hypothetical protein